MVEFNKYCLINPTMEETALSPFLNFYWLKDHPEYYNTFAHITTTACIIEDRDHERLENMLEQRIQENEMIRQEIEAQEGKSQGLVFNEDDNPEMVEGMLEQRIQENEMIRQEIEAQEGKSQGLVFNEDDNCEWDNGPSM